MAFLENIKTRAIICRNIKKTKRVFFENNLSKNPIQIYSRKKLKLFN
ncbi:hypothetical protein HMPREF0204_10456 [Chryseobacterium gleum ATCC 35910]|uniref:Uncharacterized protein n=1 Tax=Chryseobacterium gleum ATCC 35910 TaxID=525257 RepID=A0ABN0AXA1_CHRGE|nr:hypothetical protein HMPREF0204_10456 [Chryseobacterium gleum ATCC 35910]